MSLAEAVRPVQTCPSASTGQVNWQFGETAAAQVSQTDSHSATGFRVNINDDVRARPSPDVLD